MAVVIEPHNPAVSEFLRRHHGQTVCDAFGHRNECEEDRTFAMVPED